MLKEIKKVLFCLLFFVLFLCYETNDVYAVSNMAQTQRTSQVILGGNAVGFEYVPKGVIVISTDNSIHNDETSFKAGDVILSINDEEIYSSSQISQILNKQNNCLEVKVKYSRNGKIYITNYTPVYDMVAKKFKLGVWVKDEISGVGTLTYINPNTGYYGALGHPITINNSNQKLDVKTGIIYNCNIVGVVKSQKGIPGELKGVISRKNSIGSVVKNTEYGVFGTIEDKNLLKDQKRLISVGGKNCIKPGKASIFCSVDGDEIKEYEIQIIKTNYQSVSDDKSLVFKVTDKNLISKTGGIVQGMSGSPIVQNGKLVGAVTHVFTNNSTRGFGIYIDWMM